MKIVPNTMLYNGITTTPVAKHVLVTDPPAPPPPTTLPPGFPIDSGILLLLAVGVLFAFLKFKTNFKHKKTPM